MDDFAGKTPLSRMSVDMIRKNTLDFIKQHGDSTVDLMPMLPKRLLVMCDTMDHLYDQLEQRDGKL